MQNTESDLRIREYVTCDPSPRIDFETQFRNFFESVDMNVLDTRELIAVEFEFLAMLRVMEIQELRTLSTNYSECLWYSECRRIHPEKKIFTLSDIPGNHRLWELYDKKSQRADQQKRVYASYHRILSRVENQFRTFLQRDPCFVYNMIFRLFRDLLCCRSRVIYPAPGEDAYFLKLLLLFEISVFGPVHKNGRVVRNLYREECIRHVGSVTTHVSHLLNGSGRSVVCCNVPNYTRARKQLIVSMKMIYAMFREFLDQNRRI